MLFNEKLAILRHRTITPRGDLAAKIGVDEETLKAYEKDQL